MTSDLPEASPKAKRFRCTKETPWDESKGTPVEHADVDEVDWSDYGGGVCVGRYKCNVCGTTFYNEIAQ